MKLLHSKTSFLELLTKGAGLLSSAGFPNALGLLNKILKCEDHNASLHVAGNENFSMRNQLTAISKRQRSTGT